MLHLLLSLSKDPSSDNVAIASVFSTKIVNQLDYQAKKVQRDVEMKDNTSKPVVSSKQKQLEYFKQVRH